MMDDVSKDVWNTQEEEIDSNLCQTGWVVSFDVFSPKLLGRCITQTTHCHPPPPLKQHNFYNRTF